MTEFHLLNKVNSPDDIKKLTDEELTLLAAEIREFLIESVLATGGHLASNLGVVEITIALHKVFNSPSDKLVFDVGHQCYTHKILTGRKKEFASLRSFGGISGFLNSEESVHDTYTSGHSSTSISYALGIARALKQKNSDENVIAVIGDGALTGGMAFEGLCDAGRSGVPLIIILNDNEMSISKNVGAIAQYLASIRTKTSYFEFKDKFESLLKNRPLGKYIVKAVDKTKAIIKEAFLNSNFFESMGFVYLGPADGHDIQKICLLLNRAKSLKCPVVIHLNTVKGKGYELAEKNPERFHGISGFDPSSGEPASYLTDSYSSVFGDVLCRLAEKDSSICAVTAAMKEGTGLTKFSEKFPDRFFDVAIAEQHAVTMSAGIAKGGSIPVCAIYSSFLQRSYDQLVHDVCLQNLHVVFAVDRAGIVGEDGEAHQGIFDIAYLSSLPNMTILSPSCYEELEEMLSRAIYETKGPVAVRYPRGKENGYKGNTSKADIAIIKRGADITVVGYGNLIGQIMNASEILNHFNIETEIIKINNLKQFDINVIIDSVNKTGRLLIADETLSPGILTQKIILELAKSNIECVIGSANFGEGYVKHGARNDLYKHLGIDGEGLASKIKEMVKHGVKKQDRHISR